MAKLLSTRYSETAFAIALFQLRVAAGALMIPHGYSKLQKFSEMAPTFSDPIHIGGTLSLSLVIFAEFFCSIFIIAGLFTRLACIPLIIDMAAALVYVHHGRIFEDGEKVTLFLAIFITILFVGPGKLSLDKMIGK